MSLRIDCDSCVMRDLACHDCMVTVLLGPISPAHHVDLDQDSFDALAVLAQSGMVPPLRLVQALPGPVVESA